MHARVEQSCSCLCCFCEEDVQFEGHSKGSECSPGESCMGSRTQEHVHRRMLELVKCSEHIVKVVAGTEEGVSLQRFDWRAGLGHASCQSFVPRAHMVEEFRSL